MPETQNSVRALADLLRNVGAAPVVRPERVVRSTLYDLDYHVAVIASAFATCGEFLLGGDRMLVAHWLKLLQFIAVRPILLDDFVSWAKARRRPDLDVWQKVPRGFLGDRTHDRVVELLVASRVLYRSADMLVGGERYGVLGSLYDDLVSRDLLRAERHTLAALAKFPVNKTLLRGE